ncbi:MAG: transposase, partial [Terriglobia bacterium]
SVAAPSSPCKPSPQRCITHPKEFIATQKADKKADKDTQENSGDPVDLAGLGDILATRTLTVRAPIECRPMPAYALKEIVDETIVGIYHCVSRCVRRAFLCGNDRYTGRNFDHRKGWIRESLEELAGIFALDMLGFSVMSNHIHVLLRNRPDVVETWTDEEVARRWYRLHPWRRNDNGTPAEPEASELAAMMADPRRMGELRRRLASLSWFMRSLCEPVARRANHEDGATGRFFEGRFKSQAVVDESALLACSIYVDLNPIRACIAETPETSEFTAAFERIAARQVPAQLGPTTDLVAAEPASTAARDAWLSPVPDADVPVELQNVLASGSARRASDRGFLPMTLDEYLELLDWTGRAVRSDKRGSIPANLLPILQRLQVNAEVWVDTIEQFGRTFRRAVGRVSSLAALAGAKGKCWFQ